MVCCGWAVGLCQALLSAAGPCWRRLALQQMALHLRRGTEGMALIVGSGWRQLRAGGGREHYLSCAGASALGLHAVYDARFVTMPLLSLLLQGHTPRCYSGQATGLFSTQAAASGKRHLRVYAPWQVTQQRSTHHVHP